MMARQRQPSPKDRKRVFSLCPHSNHVLQEPPYSMCELSDQAHRRALLSSALPAVTPITDSPESMGNHKVGGACRLTLNGGLPAMESQLEQSRSGETSRSRLEMEPPVWR